MTRIRQQLQPDWVHSVRARRIAAAALVVLAGAAAIRSDPDGAHSSTVVAARELTPGTALSADDVRVENRPVDTVPDGAHTDVDAVLGSFPSGPVRTGEILTDVRLFGSKLPQAAVGPDARMVPLHLAQSAVLDVLREGDVVDIVAAPQSGATGGEATARIIATEAVIVMVSAESGGLGGQRVVLVALPAAVATGVAAATLNQLITLTLH